MSDRIDRLGGSLMNVVLGALILWVGQTTFRHAGLLAGVDEKLQGVQLQFADAEKSHEGLRKWLQNVVDDMKDSSRAQFTMKDGDKLVAQVRQAELFMAELERRNATRISALEAKLAALEAHHYDLQHVAALQIEVAQLRSELARSALAQQAIAHQLRYQPAERVAQGPPVFLPPVENRR